MTGVGTSTGMRIARAAIFDLDGVLVDTAVHHFAAWRAMAQGLGFTLADEDEELLKGVGRMDALRIVLGLGGVEVSDEEALRLAAEKNAQYVKAISMLTPDDMLPGALELLRDLRSRGVPTALGSASRNAPLILDRLGIRDLLDVIIDGSVVSQAKPDPAVFRAGAEALGVAAEDCVVFEDAIAGVEAAHRAGMTAVGVGDATVLGEADVVIPGLHAAGSLADHGITFEGSPATSLKEETMSDIAPVRLGEAPFHLDADAQVWVASTRDAMTLEQKVGQLFFLMANDPAGVDADIAISQPGGFMRRGAPVEEAVSLNRHIHAASSVPPLIAGNLENGADGASFMATQVGTPLQAAATGDDSCAYRMGEVAAVEGRALGVTWDFAPIIDIQLNPRNPIVLNRAFGSDPDRVRRMGVEFVRGLQDNGVAASVKHWPGDGVDDRDQHLLTSVNSLSVDEWEATFGAAYRASIEAGALSVMAAHIALPAYSRALRPGIADEDIMPASLAPELTTELLREHLGFNGVVITDASLMGGMLMRMPRAALVPASVAAGCDMFLFTPDYATDHAHMLEGVRSGVISQERLDQAVTRVLALKAALGLHAPETPEERVPGLDGIDTDTHRAWSRAQADAGITLIKDKEAGLLPLDTVRHRRVLVYSLRGMLSFTGPAERFTAQLNERGFSATLFEDGPPGSTMFTRVGVDGGVNGAELLEGYDAVIYVADVQPRSNETVARVHWAPFTAGNLPRHLTELPTLFVSLGSPYHLQDVPFVRTYVNAYAANDETVDAVVAKLVGESEFRGVSPVDPFMGYEDARW
ncbi:beta-phosphoglucomutase [Demequina capsici]|uniref:beta-N-acetylhexosaminidase n=1 Tax=Demequina capsici TaxID=3075620 RepID=A0AA96F5Y6_9MICO|nr:beta-phosphoglucomutase [Demequina sp. OYTSA14]WNM23768.1 beta-phosphoglucomutase [Demequina sp. OYTSA14]